MIRVRIRISTLYKNHIVKNDFDLPQGYANKLFGLRVLYVDRLHASTLLKYLYYDINSSYLLIHTYLIKVWTM